MKYTELNIAIDKKEFYGICLLHGEEEYLKDKAIMNAKNAYISQGLEDLNINNIEDGSMQDISSVFNMPPFMSEKRILIVRNYNGFNSKKNNINKNDVQLLELMLKSKNTDSCLFFLCRGKVDASNTLMKLIKKHKRDVSYNSIRDNAKYQIIMDMAKEKDIKINKSNAMFLLNYTNASLSSIDNELDKLSSYTSEAIKASDIRDICPASLDYNIFTMITAIGRKDASLALTIFRDMVINGEYLGTIVSMIERQYRTYAYIEDIANEYKNKAINYEQLEQRLNVKGFVIQRMYRQGSRLDQDKRDEIINWCCNADYLVKKGRLKDEAAVENLIMKLINI